MADTGYFAVKLRRSGIGRPARQKKTLEGLGLRGFGREVFLKDTPAVRGMLYKVVHLVSVERREGEMPLSKRQRKSAAANA